MFKYKTNYFIVWHALTSNISLWQNAITAGAIRLGWCFNKYATPTGI